MFGGKSECRFFFELPHLSVHTFAPADHGLGFT